VSLEKSGCGSEWKDDFFFAFLVSGHVQITISSTELFDFSEGEPPEEYLTMFRALDVS